MKPLLAFLCPSIRAISQAFGLRPRSALCSSRICLWGLRQSVTRAFIITAPCAVHPYNASFVFPEPYGITGDILSVGGRLLRTTYLRESVRLLRTAACKRVGLASLQAARPLRHADSSEVRPCWTRLLLGPLRDSSTWTWAEVAPSTYDLQTDVLQPSRQVYIWHNCRLL